MSTLNLSDYNLKDTLLEEVVSEKGIQNIVYRYDSKYVLKVPRKNIFFYILPREKPEEDLALVQAYFDNYMVPETKVIHSQNRKDPPVILQTYLDGLREVTMKDMQNVVILKQVEDILDKAQILHSQKKLSLDLVGWNGALGLFIDKIMDRKIPWDEMR